MTNPADKIDPPEGTVPSSSDPLQSDEAVHSPFDRLLNRALQQLEAARSLLYSHLPCELLEHLNIETLAVADTSFIDANLKRRFADRLFSVEVSQEVFASLGMKTRYVNLLVLVDHKSSSDSHTVIQLLGYILRIWENAIENAQPLVPIIPWVIYNGVRPWRAARSLHELIPVPESWKRYVPGMELPILDISRMADEAMAGEPVLQVTLLLLKYGREPELDAVIRSVFRLIAEHFEGPRAASLLDTVRKYIMSVNPVVGEEKLNQLFSEFWPVKPEPGSVADQLLNKGRKEGLQEGRQEGEIKGEIKLVRTLQSILKIPQSSDEQLAGKSLKELQVITESLQKRIINRST